MGELYKKLAVIFFISAVVSVLIFTAGLYAAGELRTIVFFMALGVNLAVSGANSIVVFLLVKRHLQNQTVQLEKARTEAEYDRLTGLYNRNGFERHAENFLTDKCPGGVLLLFDLDNFKQINDGEGHPEGDRVLQIFAGCLADSFRKADIVGRLGGDEFAVLICGPVPQDILADKIAAFRMEVRSRLDGPYGRYRVSASIGAAPAYGTSGDYRKLYRCADTALYISKYRGKDSFYFNEKMIDCMRRECIGCRTDCPRSSIINRKDGK